MSLVQVTSPTKNRFSVLYTYIKRNRNAKKIMIVCCAAKTAEYFQEIMVQLLDTNMMVVHEKQHNKDVMDNLEKFRTQKSGVMFTSNKFANNSVAKEKLLEIDCTIIQYDPPCNLEDFLGLLNEYYSKKNTFILFLRPEEKGFLQKLKETKINIEEISYNGSQVADVTPQINKLVSTNYALHMSATEGYRGYMRSYNTHSLKEIFDIDSLSFDEVAASFGFSKIPAVDISEITKKISPSLGTFEHFHDQDYSKPDNFEYETEMAKKKLAKLLANDAKNPQYIFKKVSKKNRRPVQRSKILKGPKKVQMKPSKKSKKSKKSHKRR
ncbi:ATP-dependent RNA helicase DDX18-like [Trichogramma pretiosum]|uniref:ATP-dependent RNA helicase DDX18-like n=1 Tax=Trichogramma pretiosum TaxID=7493 RepID=UPI0006C946A9|nr:ATP-dependent RNA helicase DDX18-like [Trichogramma pretiosum]